MILDHVTQGAGLLVELAAAGDAERFGHRDLHAGDVVAVPHRLEERVGEAEVQQVLHRLLAEVMIDAKDAALGEVLVQRHIELPGALEIAAEGLLHHHAGALSGGRGQVLDHDREHARRDGEVVQRALRRTECLLQRCERGAIVVIAVDVTQQADEARRHGCIDVVHELLEALAHARGQLLELPALPRHADHRHAEEVAAHQVIQRRIDLAIAQVPGRPEEHQRVRVATFHAAAFRGGVMPVVRRDRRNPVASPRAACWRTRSGRANRSARRAPHSARTRARRPRSPPAPSSDPRRNRRRGR